MEKKRVRNILELEFITADTIICIRDGFTLLAAGKKKDSMIQFYVHCPVHAFAWQDNSYVYIDLDDDSERN